MTTPSSARELWKEGRIEEAQAASWDAYDANPAGLDERRTVARMLRDYPDAAKEGRAEALRRLAADGDIEPRYVCRAGWLYLQARTALFAASDDAADLARKLEAEPLALTLLGQDVVDVAAVEHALTRVRRWLLDGQPGFARLRQALIAQAALNGGAWTFDDVERARFADSGDFVRAYLPPRENIGHAAYADPITQAVAEQYEGWPYPQWTRVTKPKATTLARHIRKLDPQGPDTIPDAGAKILIAGCGTGRQVALAALRYDQDSITAIDISQASLRHAERRCAAAGVRGVEYLALDLHAVDTLGCKFDAVLCTGVLHHLPDPEAGWTALAKVLNPGGAMHVMVYSKVARMRVVALRRMLSDLASQPMSDALLREVRRRVLSLPKAPLMESHDFYSLAGVHDLLMHRHEDPFDIARIRSALETLDLKLIQFEIPQIETWAAYRKKHPDDPLQRDFAGWTELERGNPTLYSGMYDLWCRKP